MSSEGDAITSGDGGVIEVRIATLKQLFNAMDPAPFHERDLDPDAEEFIVSWSRELPRDAKLSLLVHLDRPAGLANEAVVLQDAIQQFFGGRSKAAAQRLRQLFRNGRISLLIGLTFLVTALGASQLIKRSMDPGGFIDVLHESLLIGGWVAMWRPIEVFLYDWWPIRADARLFDRLAAMPVHIKYGGGPAADAWRQDWPAVSPSVPGAERDHG